MIATGESFAQLKRQYFLLDREFNRLFAASTMDEQRDQLRRDYVTARDNFWAARSRVFEDDEPLVKRLNAEIQASGDQIERALGEITDAAAVLRLMSAWVSLGSSLVTLGSVR